MAPRKLVLLGGFAHESNGFSPVPTARSDVWMREAERFEALLNGGEEYDGAGQGLRAAGFEISSGLAAGAGVGGMLEWAVLGEYLARLDRVLADAQAQGIQGILWVLHGSAAVQGVSDAQGEILARIRHVFPETPLVVSADLHSTLTWRVMQQVDGIVHYRTAPHVDIRDTGTRAAELLALCITDNVRTDRVLIKLPLLLPGEFGQTDNGAMRHLGDAIARCRVQTSALDLSLSQGFPWADNPAGMVSLVGTWREGDLTPAAIDACQTVARAVWNARVQLYDTASLVPLSELGQYRDTRRPTVFCDTGDNPTAGGTEDRVDVLAHALTEKQTGLGFLPLVDPNAVRACRASDAQRENLKVRVGGALSSGASLELTVRVRQTGHHSQMGDWAVVAVGGNLLVLTSQRFGVSSPALLTDLGLANELCDWVVKSGYLFPDWTGWLKAYDGRNVLLATPGATSLDLRTFPYTRMPADVFPLQSASTHPRMLQQLFRGRLTGPVKAVPID